MAVAFEKVDMEEMAVIAELTTEAFMLHSPQMSLGNQGRIRGN